MNVLDLFSGIGGFSLGLERAGMRTVAFCEIEKYCRQVLAKHWPGVPIYEDIRQLTAERLEADGIGAIDLVCGGDPCQANSNAHRHGRTAGTPANHFLRLVEEVHPRFVLRENPATVRRDAPWPWWRFAECLNGMGYMVLPFKLRACCVGADFRGERLFLFAVLPEADGQGLEGYVREILADSIERGQYTNIAGPVGGSASPRVCGKPHGIPNRVDRLKGLGNAVVPQVVEVIARAIMEAAK